MALLIAGRFFNRSRSVCTRRFRGDIMSNPNKPFHNLSFDPAEMVAVIEASDLACQTLQNIGQLEVDREVIAEEFCEP